MGARRRVRGNADLARVAGEILAHLTARHGAVSAAATTPVGRRRNWPARGAAGISRGLLYTWRHMVRRQSDEAKLPNRLPLILE